MKFLGYAILTFISLGILSVIIAIAGVGWVINYYGSDIPDYNALKTYEPDVVTRVYTGDGQLMAEFATEKRVFVPIEVIPKRVIDAFISAEDKNFFEHKGLDYLGIGKAILDKLKNPNGRLRGASTITQQVAKNFLLTNERSFERKIKEAILAIRMERALSKYRLLELYLNEIYLGIGTYGVAAASQQYFGKSLDELTIEEVAFLAALPKAPNDYHPVRKRADALERRNWVISQMEKNGYISDEEAAIAQSQDLKVDQLSALRESYKSPYFAEEIRRFLQKEYGNEGLYKQGLLVKSSINPQIQEIAVQSLRSGLMAYDIRRGYRGTLEDWDSTKDWQTKLKEFPNPKGKLDEWQIAVILNNSNEIGLQDGMKGLLSEESLEFGGDKLKKGSIILVEKSGEAYTLRQVPLIQGAIVALDPHTGRVLAAQGGWDYQKSEFNRVTQAKRQPGSSFKPFIYLTALEQGMTPATIIVDSPVSYFQGPGLPLWRPQNYSDEFYGPTTLRVGIEKSRNVMTVKLSDKVGMETIADTAKRFGIYDSMHTNLAASLGSDETTLMRMVTAYGMIVNGGKQITPTFIDRIQNRYGETVFKRDDRSCSLCGPKIKWADDMAVPTISDERPEVTSPQRAYQMVSILEGVVQRGTATKLRDIGLPVAGKTGTTNDSKDAWFIGFTPDLVFGAYIGFDKPRQLGKKETGASAALPIIQEFLEGLKDNQLIEPIPFRVPSGVSLIQINASNGRRAYPGTPNVIWEAFMSGETPEMQTTVRGGETKTDEPFETDIDYNELFNSTPLPSTELETEPRVETQPSDDYDILDPNGVFKPESIPQPEVPPTQPSLQGTGGIY